MHNWCSIISGKNVLGLVYSPGDILDSVSLDLNEKFDRKIPLFFHIIRTEDLNVFFSEVQNGHGLAAFAALSPVGKKIIFVFFCIIVFVFLISFEKDIYLKLMPKTLNHLQAKTQLCIPFHRLRLSLKF